MTLQAQPHKRFDKLMEAEDQRQHAERVVARAPVPMSKDVDPDASNEDAAYKIGLRGEAHASKLQRTDAI